MRAQDKKASEWGQTKRQSLEHEAGWNKVRPQPNLSPRENGLPCFAEMERLGSWFGSQTLSSHGSRVLPIFSTLIYLD